ncbi:hypothetical protein DQ04_03481060 [Trypanosoma grayi]|uniref:hypothetical protein n=1 Tax=Trypanosoma grayi TaxID=71804 RepID=UPI0004F4AE53|nr:hypothetical protein DQ04_03481060 [Trypanosoma grayi]KEG10636.1 hypothetical protein DQ04_03481060 [Trypanosoma grayi]
MQLAGPLKKPSAFEAAADQASYRVADVQLASCRQHGGAAVLCSTAGKTGRNGRSAAVGATLFWLTCPYLNTMVARLERHGAVGALQKLVDNNANVAAQHVASHRHYEERARALLSAERWEFFSSHFTSGSESQGNRKYGNAAVSHAKDLKCLHALVAQSLCGAPNVIGDAILFYMLFLSQKVETFDKVSEKTASHTDDAENDSNDTFTDEKRSLDDVSALVAFVESWSSKNVAKDGTSSTVLDADDVCSAACNVLTFLEGRPPRPRKKHRIN